MYRLPSHGCMWYAMWYGMWYGMHAIWLHTDVCDMATHTSHYRYHLDARSYVCHVTHMNQSCIGTVLMHVNASVVQEDVRLHLRQQLRQSLRYLRVVSHVCVMSRARLSHVACMNASSHKSMSPGTFMYKKVLSHVWMSHVIWANTLKSRYDHYGVAMISRLPKSICLFCKRAL